MNASKKIIISQHKKLLLVFFLISILVNIALIINFIQNKPSLAQQNHFEQLQKKYPLLSKRILRDFPQDVLINFLDLRTTLHAQVTPYGDKFSFYFEYLPTGTSIGINDRDEFHAASLFKVPVVMAYYHQRESLGITGDLLAEVKQEDLDSEFGNLWKKGAGYKIKFSQAVRLALEESDNTAAKLIARNISEEDFTPVYEGIDIDLTTDSQGALLTAKNYTSVLKALYFSAVLNKDDSQEILDLLTKSKFNDKLVAGVDSNVPVAHKIGDFIDQQTNNHAYMDCGIVYLPRRPYILCMLSMSDNETAKQRMQMVSKTIYDYVSSVK